METDTVNELVRAGAAATVAKDRVATITWRGVDVPVVFDDHGAARTDVEWQAWAESINPVRSGRYDFASFASLVAWCMRYATADATALIRVPSDAAVGPQGKALHIRVLAEDLPAQSQKGALRRLTADFVLPYSPELREWLGVKKYDAARFDEFIDRHQDELANADLITAIRNIEVHASKTWKRVVKPDGTLSVQSEEHQGTVKIPRAFKFVVPVFASMGGTTLAPTQLTARLTCEIVQGAPQFSVEVLQLDTHVLALVDGLAAQLAEVVPHYYYAAGVNP